MTETQAFKKWFGKSVVKSNGKPIVLYHGSNAFFNSIDPDTFGRGNDQYGSGFYLTDNTECAEAYGANVLRVYVRIEKPMTPEMKKPLTKVQIRNLIVSAPNYKHSLEDFGDMSYDGLTKVLNDAINIYADHTAFDAFQLIQNDFWKRNIPEYLKTFIKVTGYDGVIIHLTNEKSYYVIFTPNQAKLVSNDGTWSRTDDDMRKNPAPPANLKLNQYYSEDADEDDERDANAVMKIQAVSGIRITGNKDLVVIAKIGNKVVGGGFYGISPGYAHSPAEAAFDIVVDEKSRGKGIGEALTKYLVNIYRMDTNSWDDDLALNLEVVNPIMEKVLSRMGYVKVEEYGKIYYRDPNAPEIT